MMAMPDDNIDLHILRNVFGSFAVLPGDRIVHEVYAREGAWERPAVEFLRERCFPDGVGTYVDAGAHVGLTSIPVALRHPEVLCYAFEPEATNFALLKMNREGNKVEGNLQVFQTALSDVTGSAQMLRDETRSVDHRMLRGRSHAPGIENEDQRPLFPVEAIRLDSLLAPSCLRPLVLKLDVQGHEAAVLRGANSLKPDVVVFEYWPYGLSREGETLEGMADLLWPYVYGTILIESSALLIADLHEPLMRTIPWDGKTTTAPQLVVSKRRI